MTKHWTEEDGDAFVHFLASIFMDQIRDKMESDKITEKQLVKLLNAKPQFGSIPYCVKGVRLDMNSCGNFTIKKILHYARAVGLKLTIFAYDDGDAENEQGPILAESFLQSWKLIGKPTTGWDIDKGIKRIKRNE